ncbi:hypothetical protein DKM44_02145 [Deinococcus irradiatisoli]|uniref:Uncharacterized protein n=1 Tax=Deinococcus irradiatisoli TaxID=2202254 RepID=A0A2Z3JFP4_9DEIO|nr:hypothetical protein [Deinococcus irradiatisoli]AWN22180.1 hypothetical protein DKM44_02145 [Deinococcus irradiatisoli]
MTILAPAPAHNKLAFIAWLLGLPQGSLTSLQQLSAGEKQEVARRLADRGSDLEAEYLASLTAPVLSDFEQAEAWLS